MKWHALLMALLIAASATSVVHANAIVGTAPVAEWTEFAVVAKPGQCPGLATRFTVASLTQGSSRSLQYVADNNRWTWQLGPKLQTLAAVFWAKDLNAGVSYRDSLEVSQAPSPAMVHSLLVGKRDSIRLGCGGTAKAVKRWRAPLIQPIDNHLLDQSDLADMEGNALATALSRRIGADHHH